MNNANTLLTIGLLNDQYRRAQFNYRELKQTAQGLYEVADTYRTFGNNYVASTLTTESFDTALTASKWLCIASEYMLAAMNLDNSIERVGHTDWTDDELNDFYTQVTTGKEVA